ncbi:MAG: hypothetical protein ABWZ52_04570 [Acidimicrobiales bacterium]
MTTTSSGPLADADAVDELASRVDALDREDRSTLVRRGLLAVVVALASFRFVVKSGAIIAGEVDPSWWIGLGWMRTERIDFGTDTLFTYGPLGLLSEPTWASGRLWLTAALVASAAVAAWFGWVVARAVRLEVNRGWAIASALGVGLLAGWLLQVTELAVLALVIDVYTRLPSTTDAPPPRRALNALGVVVGLLLLAKVNSGVVAAVALAVLVLAWGTGRQRVVRLATTAGVATAALVLGWLITGNELRGLAPWGRGSVDLMTAYGSAMVANGYSQRWSDRVLLAVAVLVVLVAATQVRRARDVGWRQLAPEAVLVALMSWFALKAGLVRFDRSHVSQTLVQLSVWIVLPSMRLRWRAIPLAALAVAGAALSASMVTGYLSDADTLLTERRVQASEVVDVFHAVVDDGVREQHVSDDKAALRAFYASQGLADPVVSALAGRRVAADGWDVAALWAFDLDWTPLATLQSYAAPTPWLDDRNADRVRDANAGPDAILHRAEAFDHEWVTWSTPATELAITCSFESVATRNLWSALHRAPDLCGEPRRIGQVRADPGEAIEVPDAGPDELVIATFEIEPTLGKQVLDLVGRDPNGAAVVIDGQHRKYVPASANSPHLLIRPDRVGDRDLPGDAVTMAEIRFLHLGGPVEATFYAVPLG